jgi:hypothetical protein
MTEKPDPLWDPDLPGDPDLERLASALGAYRHVPRTDVVWSRPRPSRAGRRRRRVVFAAAATLAACAIGIATWLPWRLQWSDGRQWAVETDAQALPKTWAIGQTLATPADQSATIRVARIGRMEILPGTRIRLSDTRTGHHRLDLLEGRVHARIWAPPGYFGIAAGAGETVDLGCEFDMSRNPRGEGTIHVTSGWIMHRVNGQETLVPAGSTLEFNARRSGIPLATTATRGFASAVAGLDKRMSEGQRMPEIEATVARTATASDRFTLLTLLTRYPALASGPIYPRLATMFDGPASDPGHREAWQRGSVHAMNLWWEQIPRPPKAWWLNWRDALG